MSIHVDMLLTDMVNMDASDLHIKVGSPPGFRVSGSLRPSTEIGPLGPEHTEILVRQILNEEQFTEFIRTGDYDCAYSIEGVARFRVNVMTQRGSMGMVLRKIPTEIPNIADLGLPEICKELAMKPRGLVLVTGPTGSGKSTTLASMIDYRNANDKGHILTMEDPIEFIHKDKKSYICQREIGADSATFQSALKRALRQDPDVILIGEMRDLETIGMALTAAETGHLVLGTLHTTGAVQTIDRMIDVFPHEAQQQIRYQISTQLQGVISQVLVPKISGGRVAAFDIMVPVSGIRALIREGRMSQIQNFMQTGGRHGMQMLDAHLGLLIKEGIVSQEEGLAKANDTEVVVKAAS